MRIKLTYSEKQEDIFFNWPSGIRYKIITKGRRGTFTNGAEKAVIDYMAQGIGPILWVDTVQSNLQRYFDRYFVPDFKANDLKPGEDYVWNVQAKQLTFNGQYCDFRSEEQGDSIEGFGYRIIILNEAGIILKNRKLYSESILPMLLDYGDSKLIAGGVPKGKKIKSGEDHLFYDLYKRAIQNTAPYMHHHLTAFDNPWINESDIKALEEEMFASGGQKLVDQEVYGKFVDSESGNRFMINFDRNRHVGDTFLDINKTLYLSIDFNLRPFCCSAYHIWQDSQGHHAHKVDEFSIPQGSIGKMEEEIRKRYYPWLSNLKLTGDRSGKQKQLSRDDNADYYKQLQQGLNLRESQIVVPPNPTHVKSAVDCNYVLFYHPDFKYSSHCEQSIFDAENVEVDSSGQIIKDNREHVAKRADFLDTDRYFINTFMRHWIEDHRKRTKK